MTYTPWQVDENAGEQDRQEKKQETQPLLLRILALPTAATAEGNGVADCTVPGTEYKCSQDNTMCLE